ncbi:hypothetical protein ACQJBY_051483 [Aegilops geniculata]
MGLVCLISAVAQAAAYSGSEKTRLFFSCDLQEFLHLRSNKNTREVGRTTRLKKFSSTDSPSRAHALLPPVPVQGGMEVGNGGDSAMEVDAEVSPFAVATSGSPVPSSVGSSARRLGLKNSIQTNFGDGYVFQIASCQEISTLAVSLSTNALKFYAPATDSIWGNAQAIRGVSMRLPFQLCLRCK